MENAAHIEFLTDPGEVNEHIKSMKGELAFDIGANGGYLASLLAEHFTKVIAVEPCDESFQSLQTRWESVVPIHMAVSDHEGYVQLGVKAITHTFGELFTGDSITHWGPDQGHRIVPCTTMDALAADYGYPDFVKIDTEGHEGYILDGAHRVFRRHPRFSIEIHASEYGQKYMDYFNEAHLQYKLVRHPNYRQASPNYRNHYWLLNI